MKISMKWLNEFVGIDDSIGEYIKKITMSGSKVETYEDHAAEIKNVVIGKIESIAKHPDADKLLVCQVLTPERVQIVTGASNIKEGDIIPVALDGSTLPGGAKIKKGKLRGVESHGMLCSVNELNLSVSDFPYADENGIFIIKEDCEIGDNAVSALGLDDVTVEFELTSNRVDCNSMIGMARETAATYGQKFVPPTPKVKGTTKFGNINNMLKVNINNKELCKRYTAAIVKNVKIEPSPRWMRERLRACGIRPINNIVDITNYIMLEFGQPMHAFDAANINGNEINVRLAKKGETMKTLDENERNLTENMLVIADKNKPVAIAGVMGGEFSGINGNTETIIFEAANFNAANVRKTAAALGMRTDSSALFGKGLQAFNTLPAIERACELVEMIGAGEVVKGFVDVDYSKEKTNKIKLETDWINQFLGISISEDEMIKILNLLGFSVENGIIEVPLFRPDAEHKADIAEEIARIYGYDNIPTTSIRGAASARVSAAEKFETTLMNTMISCGYSEIVTFSFISPKSYEKIMVNIPNSITIRNPLGEDTSVMRTTAVPSMMEVLKNNYNNRNESVKMFEIATLYIPNGENELPNEVQKLIIGSYDMKNNDESGFYEMKGAICELLETAGISEYEFCATSEISYCHPGRTALISINGTVVGEIGEVHPKVAKNYEIGTKAYITSLDMATLLNFSSSDKSYHPIPRFPSSSRDLAVICDTQTPVGEIEKIIKKASGKLCESVSLFDIYKGEQTGKNKKSVAYNIVFRAADRTLTDDEIDTVISKTLKELAKIDAVLRS